MPYLPLRDMEIHGRSTTISPITSCPGSLKYLICPGSLCILHGHPTNLVEWKRWVGRESENLSGLIRKHTAQVPNISSGERNTEWSRWMIFFPSHSDWLYWSSQIFVSVNNWSWWGWMCAHTSCRSQWRCSLSISRILSHLISSSMIWKIGALYAIMMCMTLHIVSVLLGV